MTNLFIGDEDIYCQCMIFHYHASMWFISLVAVHPLISSTVRSDPRCARQKRKKKQQEVSDLNQDYFNPSMDKKLHPSYSVGWNYLSIPKLRRCLTASSHYMNQCCFIIKSPNTTVYSTFYSKRRSKKTSKLRVTGLCEGNSPVTGEFPA